MLRLKNNPLECHWYDQRDIPDKYKDSFSQKVAKNLTEFFYFFLKIRSTGSKIQTSMNRLKSSNHP